MDNAIIKQRFTIQQFHTKETFLENPFEYNTNHEETDCTIQIFYTNQQNLFKQTPTGSTELFPISNCLKLNIHHKIRVYQKNTKTCIITNRLPTQELLLKLLSVLPILYPDIIDREHYHLFKNISTMPWDSHTLLQDPTYVMAIKLISKFKKDASLIQEKLTTFYENKKVGQIALIKNHINSAKHKIEAYTEDIQSEFNRLKDYEEKLFILENKPAEVDTEGLQTFCKILNSAPEIIDFSLNDNILTVAVVTPIKWFDEQAVERLSNTVSNILLKNFYKRVLLDQEYTLNTYAIFNYNLTSGTINSKHDTSILERVKVVYPHAIPNPHIMGFNCWGQNKVAIMNATRQSEYHIALTQILAAVANLNVYDAAVINRLMQYCETTLTPFGKDGKQYTAQEALSIQ
jgi:hypothetical protein